MSAISTILTRLRAAIWAIDVRDDIANAIEQCYSDVSNPTLKTEALEAALQTKIDEGEMAALTIGDGTITGAKLANGTIPKAKLDPSITFDTDPALDTTSTNAIQNKAVAGAISTLQADLGVQTGIISKTEGYYINLTTDPVSLTPSATPYGNAYAIIDCTTGDKFIVNAVGAVSGRAWGFLDSSNHVLSMADANATVTDLELTAPANAVKLIINDKGGGISYKVGNNLVSRVSEIEKGGSLLSDDVKAALLACFDYVAWKGTNGDLRYDALYSTLYPNAYPTIKWDKSIGRLPSTEDGIITQNNSENIFASFDSLNGICIDHNSSVLDSQYIIYGPPTDYNTCKKGMFEVSINIATLDDPGNIDVRLSDGTGGLRVTILPNKKMAIHDGNTRVPIQGVELNTRVTYNIKYEFEQNGTNRIYINDTLVYEGDKVATSYTYANRFFITGKTTCYIQSMKWTIKEV